MFKIEKLHINLNLKSFFIFFFFFHFFFFKFFSDGKEEGNEKPFSLFFPAPLPSSHPLLPNPLPNTKLQNPQTTKKNKFLSNFFPQQLPRELFVKTKLKE